LQSALNLLNVDFTILAMIVMAETIITATIAYRAGPGRPTLYFTRPHKPRACDPSRHGYVGTIREIWAGGKHQGIENCIGDFIIGLLVSAAALDKKS